MVPVHVAEGQFFNVNNCYYYERHCREKKDCGDTQTRYALNKTTN